MKKCTKCGEVKALGEFSLKSISKQVLDSQCKGCRNAYAAIWRAENRERIAKQNAKYREVPAHKIKALARSRQWRRDNPERAQKNDRSEKKAMYRAENRGALNATIARIKAENPELKRAYEQRTRMRDAAIDASRAKLTWTAAEDAVVMSWMGGMRELGATLGRTRVSVQHRRNRLRKRAAEQAANTKEVNP